MKPLQQQNLWSMSEAVASGVVDNLPLIKVADMMGYDAETRPGAAARAEQQLGLLPR